MLRSAVAGCVSAGARVSMTCLLTWVCACVLLVVACGFALVVVGWGFLVGARRPLKNSGSHIDASHSRQPLVKGERLVRYEVNAVMRSCATHFFC